jgi:hypothetical protein
MAILAAMLVGDEKTAKIAELARRSGTPGEKAAALAALRRRRN